MLKNPEKRSRSMSKLTNKNMMSRSKQKNSNRNSNLRKRKMMLYWKREDRMISQRLRRPRRGRLTPTRDKTICTAVALMKKSKMLKKILRKSRSSRRRRSKILKNRPSRWRSQKSKRRKLTKSLLSTRSI